MLEDLYKEKIKHIDNLSGIRAYDYLYDIISELNDLDIIESQSIIKLYLHTFNEDINIIFLSCLADNNFELIDEDVINIIIGYLYSDKIRNRHMAALALYSGGKISNDKLFKEIENIPLDNKEDILSLLMFARIKMFTNNKLSMYPKPINVLFIGGGRRVSLAERFIKHNCKIFAYETNINSPISKVAKIINGLKWNDSETLEHLNFSCRQNNIDLVIPLQDQAIPLCCKLNNINVPASFNASEICFDKKKFEEYFINVQEYPHFDLDEDIGRIIVKPRFGFNSQGVKIVWPNDLAWNYGEDLYTNNIIQKYIEGEEYSVDCYFNKHSELIDFVPRKRVSVQGGEVVISTTIDRNNLLYNRFGDFISDHFKKLKAIGPYCIQFIVEYNNIYLIEANARFGGGVILSLEAGFDIVKLIIDEYINNISLYETFPVWKENLTMARYFSEVFYDSSI